ncbi:MAG: patatin-like phospholipase family protein [Bacillota bacterium]
MKRALVLSGGGSHGAFEVGALNYLLQEKNMDFHIFRGSSVGALNASVLAQAGNYDELLLYLQKLNELWSGIKSNRDIYDGMPVILRLLLSGSLYRPRGLARLINHNIDPAKLFSSNRLLMVATVAGEDGELRYADNRNPAYLENFPDYILASASIPIFFPPVVIQGKHWFDGGLRDVTPLSNIFDEKPDEIVIIVTYPLTDHLTPAYDASTVKNSFSILKRAISITLREICANDIQLAFNINDKLACYQGKQAVPITLIYPRNHCALDSLDFNSAGIKQLIRSGYECARDILARPVHKQ